MRGLFDRVFSGNDEMYAKAVHDLDEAIAKYGADHVMQFPDTAYNCACILEYTGISVRTLADPRLEIVRAEATGSKLGGKQRAFRAGWIDG